MKHGDDISPQIPDVAAREQLSGTVAHELNNIVAALRGFIELAQERTAGNVALLGVLAEVGIGVDRAAALAADLALLAGAAGPREPVSIGECLQTVAQDGAGEFHAIRWECPPTTVVIAHAPQVRAAAAALARLGTDADGSGAAIECRLAAPGAPPASCLLCGADVGAEVLELSVRLPADVLRALSGRTRSRRAHLTAMELRLVALGHAAHCAGGHLLRGADPALLRLVLLRA